MAKRIISLLLILSMLVTGFAVTASAADVKPINGEKYTLVTNEAEFVEALNAGVNVMLQSDIALTVANFAKTRSFGVKANVIIDGNGHTLTYPETRSTALWNFLNGEKTSNGTTIVRNINFGTKNDPIVINGADGLFKYANNLGCELVFENVNFYIKRGNVNANSGALFAKIATIAHFRGCTLDVDMTEIKSGSLHGGWFGEVASPAQIEMENCTTIGDIVAPAGAAGFVGQNTTGFLKFTGCKNFANVTAPMYTAGFVANMGMGADATYATDCINYGTITSTGNNYESIAGGIYARVSNRTTQSTWRVHTIYNCVNFGKITAGNAAGGLLGRNHDYDYDGRTFITIGGGVNVGTVSGTEYAGGIIGVGSPMAFCNELTDSVNIGTVISSNGYAGNFAGVLSGGAKLGTAAIRDAIVDGGIAAGVVSGAAGKTGSIVGLDNGTYKIGAGAHAGKNVSVTTPKYSNVTYLGTAATVPTGVTKTENTAEVLAALTERLGAEVMLADSGDKTARFVLAAPALRGVQLSGVVNNKLALRLVAGVYAKDAYKSYGFEVTITRADGTSTTNIYNATEIVSQIEEHVGGKAVAVKAENAAAKYFYTVDVANIPANERVSVKVTPIAVSKDGTKAYTGNTKMLAFTNGQMTHETMSLNGVLLENFAIIYKSTNTLAEKTLATHLSKKIAELTGADLPVIKEKSTHNRTYVINVGKTADSGTVPAGRNISTLANSASIVISGDNTAQLGEAVQYFITLLEEKVAASDNAMSITAPIQAPADTEVSLMTFNMGAKDNNIIKQHEWDLIVDYLPDIFTSQEPWAGFLDDFCNNYAVRSNTKFQASGADDDVMETDVDNKAFTGNDYYGIYWGMPRWVPGGLNNQGKASYSVIFYAKDRFTVNEAKSGTFWFSNTPDVVGSKIEGSSHPRCATYVTLTDVNTGEEFVVVNVHLDHVARQIEQCNVLLEQLAKRVGKDTRILVTGDMNSHFASQTIQHMMNNETMPLTSLDYLAKEAYCSDGPFAGGGIIDWLFTNTPEKLDVTLYRYCKDFNMFNNLWNSTLSMGMPSDHPAVLVKFRFK